MSLEGKGQAVPQNSIHADLKYVRCSTEVATGSNDVSVHLFCAPIAVSEGLLVQQSWQVNSFSNSKSTFKLLACMCRGLQLVT